MKTKTLINSAPLFRRGDAYYYIVLILISAAFYPISETLFFPLIFLFAGLCGITYLLLDRSPNSPIKVIISKRGIIIHYHGVHRNRRKKKLAVRWEDIEKVVYSPKWDAINIHTSDKKDYELLDTVNAGFAIDMMMEFRRRKLKVVEKNEKIGELGFRKDIKSIQIMLEEIPIKYKAIALIGFLSLAIINSIVYDNHPTLPGRILGQISIVILLMFCCWLLIGIIKYQFILKKKSSVTIFKALDKDKQYYRDDFIINIQNIAEEKELNYRLIDNGIEITVERAGGKGGNESYKIGYTSKESDDGTISYQYVFPYWPDDTRVPLIKSILRRSVKQIREKYGKF